MRVEIRGEFDSVCPFPIFKCPLVPNGDQHDHCSRDDAAILAEGEDRNGHPCATCTDCRLCDRCKTQNPRCPHCEHYEGTRRA